MSLLRKVQIARNGLNCELSLTVYSSWYVVIWHHGDGHYIPQI